MPANIISLGARLTLAAAGLSLACAAVTHAAAPKPAANAVKAPSVPAPKPAPATAPTTPPGAASAPAVAAPAVADAGAAKEKGRELFATWGCASCHALADADASGHVGPAFDNNPNLTKDFVVNRVTNGQGAMPAFGGQMTDEEIQAIATYITSVAQK